MEFHMIIIYILLYIGLVVFFFYIISLKQHYRTRKNNEGKSEREMATDKKVSIVIPAFNEEESIEKTLDSALKIDYPKDKLEIIVIDDGSKDNTYKLAKKYSNHENVGVFTKENKGKGKAINKGISKSTGEIVFTMDADTFVQPDAVKRMVAKFDNPEVMCVSPAMIVYNPKGFLQKIVHAEYMLGIFLRKVFATMNAVHITPGAFSAYRKEFFNKHGGFDENNITEDMELAMRIQVKDGVIENDPEAVVYTISPKTFKSLLFQRRRWYVGVVRNLWMYRKELFSRKKGVLGTVILPLVLVTMTVSVFLTFYIVIRALLSVYDNLFLLSTINFDFSGFFEFGKFFFENFIYNTLNRPELILTVMLIFASIFYLSWAKRISKYKGEMKLSLIFFLILYTILFSFWWLVAYIYILSNKKVTWREKHGKKK